MEKGFEEIRDYVGRSESVDELLRDIDDEYVRLFLGPGKAEVMPYQSTYEGHRVYGETTLRIKNIYKSAGLRMPPSTGLSEDHIGAELRFIAQLCSRCIEKLGREEDVSELLEMQKEFLEENMLPWISRFCRDVVQSAEANFYRGMAMVTEGFLEEDRKLLYKLIAQL